ncbi:efflux RND transporter periplasmic adaptor subunit [Neptunicella marina]|uniref:Efflux RND transporter periplasmic adaptor subunit n=1 Tax=Neptunicella marina TaxID=2125989 RepID=A0A8J6M1P1_9ALTE|nr:efflux RND transporter periplasmic adaptor subunit [Neptunicella marina]MBC3765668.1 efflux RND transporter periplasmic adaptor subunit [Neptunicella marina]
MKTAKLMQTMLLTGAMALLAGCGDEVPAQQAAPAAPQVSVASVVSERLTEWDEFTGRLEAPQTVELRPRVSGYVDIVAFKEGSLVKAGDTLFMIDNRPYKAEVKRLQAQLLVAQSQQELAERELHRAKNLSGKQAIAEELLDNRRATLQQAEASVESVKAALELAKLNLGYTRVEAPISGRVSRALITQGNYVNAGQSVLTSIVSTERLYAYFDADEQTLLKYKRLDLNGEGSPDGSKHRTVLMSLASDNEYRFKGELDFFDNQVNVHTGTIRARAVFDNQQAGLVPGLFARIKLVGSASYQGILIDDKAIGTDLDNKFVLVVNDDNLVNYRAVELGEKVQGLRIIKSGLSAGDKIVVNGLQRVRPGSKVTVQAVDMVAQKTIDRIQALQQRMDGENEDSLAADLSIEKATAVAGSK